MRILWHSNAPWNGTGYGVQTALFVPRIQALGHEIVAISAPMSFGGAVLEWEGIKVLPCVGDVFGNDTLGASAGFFESDLVITLCDPFGLHQCVPDLAKMNLAMWFPVDCDPLGDTDVMVLRESHCTPIAMSKFGTRQLLKEGAEPFYIPHGIDTDLFSPGDGTPMRDALDVGENTFVIGINAMNRDIRKGWGEQFMAFAKFHRKYPDSVLAVHSSPVNPKGMDLEKLALHCGVADAVRFPDAYSYNMYMVSQEQIASWYRGLDVLSICSYGEGFGLPIIEAQACGIPVVTTDAASMTELCGTGWLVSSTPYWSSSHQAWWRRPDVDDIYDAYETAFHVREDGTDLSVSARAFALQYDVNHVAVNYWKPVLEQIEAAI